MTKELLQQALDSLEESQQVISEMTDGPSKSSWCDQLDGNDRVIASIRAALAQPMEPMEPAANDMPDCWVVVKNGSILGTHDKPAHIDGLYAVRYVPAIAQPVQPAAPIGWRLVPVDLTDKMLSQAWRDAVGKCDHQTLRHMYRNLISNAPESTHSQPVQPATKDIDRLQGLLDALDGAWFAADMPFRERATIEIRRWYPAPVAQAELQQLCPSEQKAVLNDLMGLECLINRHDVWVVEAEAQDMYECVPAHENRILELLNIGRAIIKQDPDSWADQQKEPFKLRHGELAAIKVTGGAT